MTGTTYTLSAYTPLVTANSRGHWSSIYRRRKAVKREVWAQARQQANSAAPGVLPLKRAHVRVTLVSTSGPFKDVDNAYSAAKDLVDGLKGVLIEDDSPQHITLEVRQERGPERCARVEVEEVG